MSNGFTLKFLAVLASALTIVGCTTISLTSPRGGSSAAWSAIVATNAPIRVAVYEDRSAGDESIFKLNRLAILSNDIDFLPVDADAICDGALDRADLFVLSAQDEKRLAQTGTECPTPSAKTARPADTVATPPLSHRVDIMS